MSAKTIKWETIREKLLQDPQFVKYYKPNLFGENGTFKLGK